MPSEQQAVLLRSIQTLFDDGATGGLADPELLDRFLTRADAGAFETLVIRYGPLVLDVCRNILGDAHDAEDAFQATFLVLARSARTVRKRDSLASWLFGVARRVAARARRDAARRREHERRAALMTDAQSSGGDGAQLHDFAVLHEEVGRMPLKYREPILLCYFQGLTYEAAARRLRCPVGTLSIRLMRARERLRGRLTRRGVAIPAGLLAAAGTATNATAAVPLPLVESTVLAAARTATGQAVTGVVSGSVVTLLDTFMKTTLRWKAVASAVLGLALLAAASTAALATRTSADGQEPAPKAPASPPPAGRWVKTLRNGETVELVGISPHPSGPKTWCDPEGRPLAQAPYARSSVRVGEEPHRMLREIVVRVRKADKETPRRGAGAADSPQATRFDAWGIKRLERELKLLTAQMQMAQTKVVALSHQVQRSRTTAAEAELNKIQAELAENKILARSATEQIEIIKNELDVQRHERAADADRLVREFRNDPRVDELYREWIRIGEAGDENAKTPTRNADDPSSIALKRQQRTIEGRIAAITRSARDAQLLMLVRHREQVKSTLEDAKQRARSPDDDPAAVSLQRKLEKLDRTIADVLEAQPGTGAGVPVDHAGRDLPVHQWGIIPEASLGWGRAMDADGQPLPGLATLVASLPADTATCTIRFGLATPHGAWKTEAVGSPTSGSATGKGTLGIVFGDPHGELASTWLTVSATDVEDEVRIVAVDGDGAERLASRTRTFGAKGFCQWEAYFPLPLGRIKEFRFQVRGRSYDWAEFTDVTLNPRNEPAATRP